MSNLELKVEKKIDDEKVESLVSEKKVTEEKIENSLNYDLLSNEEKEAIEKFNKELDIHDATQVIQFGTAAQEKISKFSDSILENVKTKSTGDVGNLLADLVSQIKSFDSDIASGGKKGFISKIFSNAKKS